MQCVTYPSLSSLHTASYHSASHPRQRLIRCATFCRRQKSVCSWTFLLFDSISSLVTHSLLVFIFLLRRLLLLWTGLYFPSSSSSSFSSSSSLNRICQPCLSGCVHALSRVCVCACVRACLCVSSEERESRAPAVSGGGGGGHSVCLGERGWADRQTELMWAFVMR